MVVQAQVIRVDNMTGFEEASTIIISQFEVQSGDRSKNRRAYYVSQRQYYSVKLKLTGLPHHSAYFILAAEIRRVAD